MMAEPSIFALILDVVCCLYRSLSGSLYTYLDRMTVSTESGGTRHVRETEPQPEKDCRYRRLRKTGPANAGSATIEGEDGMNRICYT